MNWLLLGAIMGMVTVFRYVNDGGGAVFPREFGPSEQLLIGAVAGSILYGVPSYYLFWALNPLPG